jgi:hypothetical protein
VRFWLGGGELAVTDCPLSAAAAEIAVRQGFLQVGRFARPTSVQERLRPDSTVAIVPNVVVLDRLLMVAIVFTSLMAFVRADRAPGGGSCERVPAANKMARNRATGAILRATAFFRRCGARGERNHRDAGDHEGKSHSLYSLQSLMGNI